MNTLFQDLTFLIGALANLGPKSGWKYWTAYRQCRKNPEKLIQWAKACRKESARIQTSNPALSASLEASAAHLHRTAARVMQICAWESTQIESTDPVYADQLADIEKRLRKETVGS
jgi:hypothetical protein